MLKNSCKNLQVSRDFLVSNLRYPPSTDVSFLFLMRMMATKNNFCANLSKNPILSAGICRCEGFGFQAVYSGIGYINQSVLV